MNETKNHPRFKRVPLLVLAALVTLTLAGHAVMEYRTDVPISTTGPPQFVAPGGGAVAFTGRLNQSAILVGGDGQILMELILEAEEPASSDFAQVPTDLVVILDRSGSMAGTKMEYARAAIGELISRLDGQDRFALVTYSSGAQLTIPLTRAVGSVRQTWHQIVESIQPNGGTNMSSGIDVAINTVEASREASRAARIILISDGLANEGDASFAGLSRRASQVSRWEYVLSTVGVGEDFNEQLMSALADAGTGNYYYLANSYELAQVFAREFEATRQTVATGLEVIIDPGKGVDVIEAAGYPLQRDGKRVSFRPGALFSGQQRSIWVTMKVASDQAREYEIGTVTLRYSEGGERYSLTLDDVPRIACVADQKDFFASVNAEAWEESVLQEAYNRLQVKIAFAVKEGRKAEALSAIDAYRADKDWMNQQMASPAVEANLEELDDLEREVGEAFVGADQEKKQNLFSKTRQSAGRDGRRAGAKK